MPMATANTPVETSKWACSWAKISDSIGDAPRPPYALGQAMPAQPPSYKVRWHARHRLVEAVDGCEARVRAFEQLLPFVTRARQEDLSKPLAHRRPGRLVVLVREFALVESEVAQQHPVEVGLERCHRHELGVGGLV